MAQFRITYHGIGRSHTETIEAEDSAGAEAHAREQLEQGEIREVSGLRTVLLRTALIGTIEILEVLPSRPVAGGRRQQY